jgi:hypothetical protein
VREILHLYYVWINADYLLERGAAAHKSLWGERDLSCSTLEELNLDSVHFGTTLNCHQIAAITKD